MKGLLVKITATLVATALFFSSITPIAFAEKSNSDILGLKAASAIMVDADSGRIIYGKNIDKVLPIASMTKMMSEYLVHEAVEEGKIDWTQKVTVTEYPHKISQNTSLSNVPLELGGQYTVKELYEAMAIYSANGATIALAELIAGSESNFVKLMNEKGKELKLGEFKFVNSSGLHNSDLLGKHPQGTDKDDENMMSARATATLAYHLLKDYPEILETAKIPKKTFQEGGKYPIKMDNWNWMLPGLVFEYEGVDGLKTGSTPTAGYSFTATAKRDDMRVITVVMKTSSYNQRFEETKKLLDYGFSNFEIKELYPKGASIKEKKSVKVSKGKEKEVQLVTSDAVKQIVRRSEEEKFKFKIAYNKKVVNDKNELLAPTKKGEKVATVEAQYTGKDSLGYLNKQIQKENAVKLVTKTKVEKANWFVLTGRAIGDFFGDVWNKTTDTIKGWF